MSEAITTKTVNLGRLPVWCGEYGDNVDPDYGYHKFNMVSYLGSSFINLKEGNKNVPVNIHPGEDGELPTYDFLDSSGNWNKWMFVANALDASIAGNKAMELIENNFFSLEIDESATGTNAGAIWGSYYIDGGIKAAYEDPSTGDIVLDYDASIL